MALPVPRIVSDCDAVTRTRWSRDGSILTIVAEWPVELPPDPPDVDNSGALDDPYRLGDAGAARYILYRIIEAPNDTPTLNGEPVTADNPALTNADIEALFSGHAPPPSGDPTEALQYAHGGQQRDPLSHTEDGQWSGFAHSTMDGPWSEFAGSRADMAPTEDGPWSRFAAAVSDTSPTLDGPWSPFAGHEATQDGPWSFFASNSPPAWTPLPHSSGDHSYLRYADVIFPVEGASGQHMVMLSSVFDGDDLNPAERCYWIMAWLGVEPDSILSGIVDGVAEGGVGYGLPEEEPEEEPEA